MNLSAERDLTSPTAKAKGRRPYFFPDPAIDKVLAITMAIAGELAVTRERLDTVERVLAAKNMLTPSDIEAYRPDDAAKGERAALRQEFIARILMILQNELDDIQQNQAEADYARLKDELAAR